MLSRFLKLQRLAFCWTLYFKRYIFLTSEKCYEHSNSLYKQHPLLPHTDISTIRKAKATSELCILATTFKIAT